VSCGSDKKRLSEEGKKVQIFEGKKAYEGCEVVDKITSENDIGSVQVATNGVRNKAADLGANYVLIHDEIKNGSKVKVIATAYECP